MWLLKWISSHYNSCRTGASSARNLFLRHEFTFSTILDNICKFLCWSFLLLCHRNVKKSVFWVARNTRKAVVPGRLLVGVAVRRRTLSWFVVCLPYSYYIGVLLSRGFLSKIIYESLGQKWQIDNSFETTRIEVATAVQHTLLENRTTIFQHTSHLLTI